MTDEKILGEARKRFRQCQKWESYARDQWRADMRFGYGDDTNLYQWDSGLVDSRGASAKPCFTVNRVKNYCYQIINDASQNKSEIEVRPVSNGASFKSAEIFSALVRYICYHSSAQEAFDKALHDCVFGGIGWYRITTQYKDADSFDQEIKIVRIPDSLSVYLDPEIQTQSGEDAAFGFIFSDKDKNEWIKDYPKYKDIGSSVPLGNNDLDEHWVKEDRIRVVEYYKRVMESDVLHYLDDGSTIHESLIEDKEMLQMVRQHSLRSRDVEKPKIMHYLIAGDQIISKSEWPGKYIPLVRVVGNETVIDGVLDRVSHVRGLISPQKSYNYYSSAGIEFVALQSKSSWISDVKAIEGVESYWRDSNITTPAVLPFNSMDDDGNALAPPHRADPPVYASAFLDGMKVAVSEMEMSSGQPETLMSANGAERSGKAIQERQRAGQNSTYHFINNFAVALRYTGKILIDLVPKVLDVEQIVKVLAQDGTQQSIKIDPNHPAAFTPVPNVDEESLDPSAVAGIFSPSVGTYEVVAEVGPQFTTRRQEFVNSMLDILAQNESLTPIIGDLVLRQMDFPGAQLVADRLRRMLPPQALPQNGDPQIQQLQQLLAHQHAVMQQMQQELEQAKNKDLTRDMQKEIDWFKAETERFNAVGKVDPQALIPIIRQQATLIMQESINDLIHKHALDQAIMQNSVGQQIGQQTNQQAEGPSQ